MSIINTNAKEIHCKIIYCGPKASGKKSILLYIRDKFKQNKIEFFKLPFKNVVYSLVLSLGKIFQFQTFFHIFNLNNISKEENETLLTGVDGIVFVASLDPKDRKKNIESFLEMEILLKEKGKDLFKTALVLQYNKKDLKDQISLKNLRIDLNKYNSKDFMSSVLEGKQILEPLKYVCKLVLNDLKRGSI